MRHILTAGVLLNVLKHLLHRDYWHAKVDTKALGDLILECVWAREENDLWMLGPSLYVLRTLLLKNCFQHVLLKMINYFPFFQF